ncbi:hypothetical protein BIV57_17255 [Mangrovactinospora gilvigrisea]|uniref:Polymerase nucleotidyl transferase domain-containing protein n=1 Tax=Mangrovactinospora gilvigrisea TaxID=1428644 RepID=A0A1J7C3V8_9ACTN|nr:nucleotidyltransferase domain-containing protein [Mangrovactinospora gilvigrisea]OIV36240.1 hypothetical protein BIV57_17255 [Mangrovactinospora gilvigrisea]
MDAPWQAQTLTALERILDDGVQEVAAYGSFADGTTDAWSDLDVKITVDGGRLARWWTGADWPSALGPVYSDTRWGDEERFVRRLILRDMRRIDAVFVAADGTSPGRPSAAGGDDPAVLLLHRLRSDAVSAAVKTARGDILIGAHRALAVVQYALEAGMLLRDRERGTDRHRFGGSRWDARAAELAAVPLPHSAATVTAAVRAALPPAAALLAELGAGPADFGDDTPLLALLTRVDAYTPN